MSVSIGELKNVLSAQFDEVKHDVEIDDAIFSMPR
jgi:hypothetical protein